MIVEHDTDAPGIAIVRSSRGWARVLHRYVVDHGGAIVRARPLEERQAIEEEYDILVVDDISSFLNNHIIEELHRRGRRVLGVFDPEEFSTTAENSGKQRLLRLGVDGVIEAGATPEEFVRIITDLAPVPTEHYYEHGFESYVDGDAFSASEYGNSSPQLSAELTYNGTSSDVVSTQQHSNRRRGHITAVLGASGGSGSTEVAIQLARSLGKRGERTVLIDGDELAPSLAQRLNLSLHPNLRTAVDVVEHGTGRLGECLTNISSGLEVLTGLPHPKDWVELRASDMTAVLEEMTRGRPQIVVNASPAIEDLSSFGGADRFGISRAIVAAADTIVVVATPTPVGVARLIDRIADITDIGHNKPVIVAVNRVPGGAFKRNEIAREIQRSFTPAGIMFLPADTRVERAAWDGTLVPSGDFTKAIEAGLARAIPRANVVSPGRRAAGSTAKARIGERHARKGA